MAINFDAIKEKIKDFVFEKQIESTPLHPYTTSAFEEHVYPVNENTLLEGRHKKSKAAKNSTSKGPQNLSLAWDDTSMGVSGTQIRDGLLSERDKKDTYYKAYIGNPWVRACVQAISKRFTSGKWELEESDGYQGKGNAKNYTTLKQLFLYINEDDDFKQLLRSIAEDLGIYGECFVEIVCENSKPVRLYKVDCLSMNVEYDMHGNVLKYVQTLDKSSNTVEFDPDQIIRWWYPDPRAGKKALSPIECMKDSVYLYQSMITWGEKFFKQGAQPGFSIEMGLDTQLDDASRYIKFFKENYMGIQNAHVPPVTYGGAKMVQFGKGSVELDFLKSLAWARDETLAAYNVPLSVTGIQETAHLGGGTGDSANKLFVYNVVKPIEQIILEKLNYRIIQKGFNIFDWQLTVQHADYRDDESIAKINDIHVRNGTMLINESRQQNGRASIYGGNEAVIISGREVTPIARLPQLADEQEQGAQIEIATKQAQVDNVKMQAKFTALSIAQQAAAGPPAPATTTPATTTTQQSMIQSDLKKYIQELFMEESKKFREGFKNMDTFE